jgi:hypothetical protein
VMGSEIRRVVACHAEGIDAGEFIGDLFTFRTPVRQFGVVWPPWQLTSEQVREPALKNAPPDRASYEDAMFASPGWTLSPSLPCLAFARW